MSKFDVEAIEKAFSMILKAIGEDCNRRDCKPRLNVLPKCMKKFLLALM